jgi:hypothetical protein
VARRLVIVALVLLAAFGIAQLVIPIVVQHEIEDRLTAAGGTADVSLSALPATDLLFGKGSRITVTGRDLDITPEAENSDVFSRLDGYDHVTVELRSSRVGPFELARFELTRDGEAAAYHMVAQGHTTPGDLTEFGASQLDLPGGPLSEFLIGQVTENAQIPIDFDMELDSVDGRIVVVSGGGTVAGIPTGPLAVLITTFVVVEL